MLETAGSELDALCTNKALCDNFFKGSKLSKFLDSCMYCFRSAFLAMMVVGIATVFPCLAHYMDSSIIFPNFAIPLYVFVPPIASAVGTLIFVRKKYKDLDKVISTYNHKLGDKSLLEEIKEYEDIKKIDELVNDKLNEVTSIMLELQKCEIILSKLDDLDSEEKIQNLKEHNKENKRKEEIAWLKSQAMLLENLGPDNVIPASLNKTELTKKLTLIKK